MKQLLLALALLLPLSLCAQSGVVNDIAIDQYGNHIAGANIRVCPSGASGHPCDSSSVLLYSDQALTQPVTNPFVADALGNYKFWLADCAAYTVQITATNYAEYDYTISFPCAAASAIYQHNTATVGQRPKFNVLDSANVTATMTDNPGNNSVDLSLSVATQPATPLTPTPPFLIPNGQAVAWAYPTTCTPSPVASSSRWGVDGYYQCGTTSGVINRKQSCSLSCIATIQIVWSGFTMPTLPGDAVIQHIYPVMISSRSTNPGMGVATISCGGDQLATGTAATQWSGYFSNNNSLGSTSGAVTGASCLASNATTLNLGSGGNDTTTVQLVALAIYYTTATPPTQTSNAFFVPTYYGNIIGVAPTFTSLADGTPISFSTTNFIENRYVTLNHTTATRALNVSGLLSGGVYTLEVIQDATGGAALTLGTGCTWLNKDGTSGTVTIGSGADAISFFKWMYDGTNCLLQ